MNNQKYIKFQENILTLFTCNILKLNFKKINYKHCLNLTKFTAVGLYKNKTPLSVTMTHFTPI